MSTLKADTIQSTSGGAATLTKQHAAKAWAEIAAGGASLPDSFNFSSIDDDGTGDYGLNYTSAMGSTNYSATGLITFNHTSTVSNLRAAVVDSKTASSVEIGTSYVNADGKYVDYDIETNANVTVQGDLA